MTAWATGSILSLTAASGSATVTWQDGTTSDLPLVAFAVVVITGMDAARAETAYNVCADGDIQQTGVQPVVLLPDGPVTERELLREHKGRITRIVLGAEL